MQVVRAEAEFNVGGRGGEEQERGRDRKFLSLSLTQLQHHYKSKKGKCHKCGLALCGICLNVSQTYPGQGQICAGREFCTPCVSCRINPCLWPEGWRCSSHWGRQEPPKHFKILPSSHWAAAPEPLSEVLVAPAMLSMPKYIFRCRIVSEYWKTHFTCEILFG